MPDYGDKKGFQGSGKGQAATGGQKKGQGSGYNAPSPQYGGSLADTQNIKGTKYSPQLAAAITASNKAAFDKKTQREFLNRMADLEASSGQKKGFKDAFKNIGKGITGITSQLSPQRLIGSVIGNALLPGIGGLLGGIIGGTYADDDPSNNFFGNIGASLKKDVRDTINFFRPEQFVTPPLTQNTPSMFPIQNVTETTGMPGMEQIPDMFPDNFGVPTFTPEAAGFGIDSLMQEVNVPANVTDDMMFRAAVTGDPYVDTNFGALTFGPTVFGAEGFKSLEEKGLVPVGVSQNITPAFLRRDR